MSSDAQSGFEHGRKDDLISIGYVLIYLANEGQLPWIDRRGRSDHTDDAITKKETLNIS